MSTLWEALGIAFSAAAASAFIIVVAAVMTAAAGIISYGLGGMWHNSWSDDPGVSDRADASALLAELLGTSPKGNCEAAAVTVTAQTLRWERARRRWLIVPYLLCSGIVVSSAEALILARVIDFGFHSVLFRDIVFVAVLASVLVVTGLVLFILVGFTRSRFILARCVLHAGAELRLYAGTGMHRDGAVKSLTGVTTRSAWMFGVGLPAGCSPLRQRLSQAGAGIAADMSQIKLDLHVRSARAPESAFAALWWVLAAAGDDCEAIDRAASRSPADGNMLAPRWWVRIAAVGFMVLVLIAGVVIAGVVGGQAIALLVAVLPALVLGIGAWLFRNAIADSLLGVYARGNDHRGNTRPAA